MVLDKNKFNAMMDERKQQEEIKRIREAPEGLVLFTSYMADKETADMYENILKMAGVDYHESLWLSRGIIKWVKGTMLFNYVA